MNTLPTIHGTWVKTGTWGGMARLAGIVLLTVSLGCSTMRRPDQADAGEAVDAMELVHGKLPAEPVVTVAEAYRAVLILADGDDTHEDFAAREQALISRGMVRPEWGLERDQAIDRGTIAYMLYRMLEMRGGVDMTLFGSWGLGDRRYALRELTYRGLMSKSATYQYISGGEFVYLLRKADEYRSERNGADKPAKPQDVLKGSASTASH